MNDKVNPRPWYANEHAVYMGADGGFSLRCCPNPEANARHIVKCVNLHDELVEALDAIVCADSPENEKAMIEKARQLLAKIDAYDGEGV